MDNATLQMAAAQTPEQMQAVIDALRAENAKLRTASTGKLTCKVSQAGGVSVYGLGRFPVTLYREQWGRLLDHAPAIRAFIEAHASELSSK